MEPLSTPNKDTKKRIAFIDGLRGIAIFMVILFHAFARWPEVYPYGDKFVTNPFLNTHIAGVNLFFIISGFVILMTLRKCKTFSDFIVRRWFRLFPSMLICSLLVLITSGLFPERPGGEVHVWDLFPGLTFIGDGAGTHHLYDVFSNTFGPHVKSIEGSFWSLYVEVRFYIVFGLAFFFLGETAGLGLIFSIFILSKLTSEKLLGIHLGAWNVGDDIFTPIHTFLSTIGIERLSNFLNSRSYGFFTAGALFFLFHVTQKRKYFLLAVAVGLFSSASVYENRIANICLTLLFVLAMSNKTVQGLLERRWMLFLGFVSYPLYLLHENMMVSMIVKIGQAFPTMPAFLIPVLPICVVIALAWLIARYLEPMTKAFLRRKGETRLLQPQDES